MPKYYWCTPSDASSGCCFTAEIPGEWLVLSIYPKELRAEVKFEAAAPVGEKAAKQDDDRIFPHLYGGLNTSAVVAETLVKRDCEGKFLSISWA